MADPQLRTTAWRKWRDRSRGQTGAPHNEWFTGLHIAVQDAIATMTWNGELTAATALQLLRQVQGR